MSIRDQFVCSEELQIEWLKKSRIYPLTVLEAIKFSKSRCRQVRLFLETEGEGALPSLWASGGFLPGLVFLSSRTSLGL